MHQNPDCPEEQEPDKNQEHKDKNKNEEENQEIVTTPAGPMPREKVHHVKPGQVVRRNPDGTYTVVDK